MAPLREEPTGRESEFSQGLARILSFPDFGEKTMPDDGTVLEELRGQMYEGIIGSSDPRLAGTLAGTLNQDSHLMPPDWVQTKEADVGLDWVGLTWQGDLPPLPGPPQASAD